MKTALIMGMMMMENLSSKRTTPGGKQEIYGNKEMVPITGYARTRIALHCTVLEVLQ